MAVIAAAARSAAALIVALALASASSSSAGLWPSVGACGTYLPADPSGRPAAPTACAAAVAPVQGVALLQARSRVVAAPASAASLDVALVVDTASADYAQTETGATVAFEVDGIWTAETDLCSHAAKGEAIRGTFRLSAWPTRIRISAAGQDAWGYSRIELEWGKFVVTALDVAASGNGYGNVHWVDASEGDAPTSRTYAVSEIPRPPREGAGSTEDERRRRAGPAEDVAPRAATEGTAAPSTASAETEGNCTTREEPRATAAGYETSPPGTPCVFGVDPRDEGGHCIMDDGEYGSLGWCYTSNDSRSWGSCSEACPLFGPDAVLGRKLDRLSRAVRGRGSGQAAVAG